MKRRILSIFTALALCLSMLPVGVLAADTEPDAGEITAITAMDALAETPEASVPEPLAEEDVPQYSGVPFLSQSVYTQDSPTDTEFTLTLSAKATEGTTYKLYTTEDRSEEAGTVVLTDDSSGNVLSVTLKQAPTRDTRYFLSATQPGKVESRYSASVIIEAYHIATELTFSYGSYEEIPYYEFYQDEGVYDIVLPTGTPGDADISIALTTANGAAVTYGGDTALTNGAGTVTATVTAADGIDLTYTYTVRFTTMSLEGSGTENDPYLISTAGELAQLADCLNSGGAAPMDAENAGAGNYLGYYFKLTNDLNLSGMDWDPVGHSGNTYFAGNFDGDGHTISNLNCTGKLDRELDYWENYTYDCSTYSAGGLFGWVAFGSVSNLILRNADVSATGYGAMSYAGGLMGAAYGCAVKDCAVYDSKVASLRTPNNSNFAGGVVGIACESEFERCVSDGNNVSTMAYGGGFIGSLEGGDSSFTDCYVANCAITGSSTTASMVTDCGAFLGASQDGNAYLTNCHIYDCTLATGADTLASNWKGLFAGSSSENGKVIANNCYYYDKHDEEVNCENAVSKTENEFANGTVTASLGEAFVQGSSGYPVLNVKVLAVGLISDSLELVEGESAALTLTVRPDNAILADVAWASSDENVATVDENGTVTAVAPGTAEITVTAENGVKTTCNVTVQPAKTVVTITGVETAEGLSYNGQPQPGYTGTLASGEYTGDYSITYTGREGTSYGPSAEAPVNAGDYIVTIAVPDSDETYTGSTALNFTIMPKSLTWDTSGLSAVKKQDGTADAATVTGDLKVAGVLTEDQAALTYTGLTASDFASADPHEEEVTLTVENAALTGTQASNYALPTGAVTIIAAIHAVTGSELPDTEDGEQLKIEIETGISEIPQTLAVKGLDTPAKIETELKTEITRVNSAVTGENTAVYDVTLMVNMNDGNGWVKADSEHFPQNGLTVTLPYPEGTNSSYKFTVVHMFTTDDFGKIPGETESPAVTNTADGIRFTVTGLSPIIVGWTESRSSGGGSTTHAVTVASASHGTVKPDRAYAAAGTDVSIIVAPNEGYKLDALTVTDARGNELKLTDEGNGKYTFKMPASKVTVEASFAEIGTGHICPSLAFTDLSTTAWYHEAVDFVLTNGMMGGYGGGLFGPNDELSRAQLCQILYNAEGKPAIGSSRFTDVAADAWYFDAVAWANANGIVDGYGGGLFGPNDPITREQLATILWRYAQFRNFDTTQGGMAIREFSDYESVKSYAVNAMTWAVDVGVVGGYEDKTLRPQNTATRAQVAQMLKNFFENLEEGI